MNASTKRGVTLVELLVATTLSLVMLAAVVEMFATVGHSITDSRSALEMADHLRVTSARLQKDLEGITVTMNPPRKPENNEGYFEYIEGPLTDSSAPNYARNTDVTPEVNDTTAGDFDDILMFTTRSAGRPFVGKFGATTIESDVAEVAWFVRGRTLYRRVLLVSPGSLQNLDADNNGVLSALELSLAGNSYYALYDLSVRTQGVGFIFNTLGDLTIRENRYAHPSDQFPFDVRCWGQSGLPTLRECSTTTWIVNQTTPVSIPSLASVDMWTNDASQRLSDTALTAGVSGIRIADDVILTNVIGFDVKAWEPEQGEYVNLGHTLGTGRFSASQPCVVGRDTGVQLQRVYDTWSTSYESTGANVLAGTPGRIIDGFDSNGNGIVDDLSESLTLPPYPSPLRGLQVKIRVFEPDSRKIREVTVVQSFLPQ